jgi:hypothetical protein
MTDRQNAKLTMYQKVLNLCNENKRVYEKVSAFTNFVNELEGKVSEILLVTRQQLGANPEGATDDKSSAIDRLVEASLKIGNPLYAYAFETKNNRLQKTVNVNKSMFYQTNKQTALTLAKIIADEANTFGKDLHDYGISDADRTELNAAIAQFEKVIHSPAGVLIERKVYTDSLRKLFVAADSILYDKLDKLIIVFKTSSPDFFSMYGNARNIINTAARKRKDKEE